MDLVNTKILTYPTIIKCTACCYPEQITVSMVEDDISTWVSPDFSASDLETTNSNNLLWQIMMPEEVKISIHSVKAYFTSPMQIFPELIHSQ